MTHDWSSMRAAEADRQRTADILKAALAEGRLTQEEYGRRLDQVMASKTYGDLQRVVSDLPSGPAVGPNAPPSSLLPASAPLQWSSQSVARPVARTNDLAKASAISGAVGFATCGVAGVPAVVTGHMAMTKINRTGEEGVGLAITGLVLGYLQLGFILMFILSGFG